MNSEIAAIMGFMIEGHPHRDIEEWARNKGLIDFDKTWNAALKKLRDAGREARTIRREWALLAMQECHRRLMDIGDYAAAAKVALEIGKWNDETIGF